ncbi:MAG: SpaA isopeptide-forming pilin-related protein [Corynebacterium sp.]|nr:SpaA isopeptide-forming pilin-related protein [Corynebacterium sp.]
MNITAMKHGKAGKKISVLLAVAAMLAILLSMTPFAPAPQANAQTETIGTDSPTFTVVPYRDVTFKSQFSQPGTVQQLELRLHHIQAAAVNSNLQNKISEISLKIDGKKINANFAWTIGRTERGAGEVVYTAALKPPVSVDSGESIEWYFPDTNATTDEYSNLVLTATGTKAAGSTPPPTPTSTGTPTPTGTPTATGSPTPIPTGNPSPAPEPSEPVVITPGVQRVPLPISNALGTDGTRVTLRGSITANPIVSKADIQINRVPSNGSRITSVEYVKIGGVVLNPASYTVDSQSLSIRVDGQPIGNNTSVEVVLRTDKMDASATYSAVISADQTQKFPEKDPRQFLVNGEKPLPTSIDSYWSQCKSQSSAKLTVWVTGRDQQVGSFIIRNINGAVADGKSLSTRASDYTITVTNPGTKKLVVQKVDKVETANDTIVTAVRVWFSTDTNGKSFYKTTVNRTAFDITGNFRPGGNCDSYTNYEVYAATPIPVGSGVNPGSSSTTIPTQCHPSGHIKVVHGESVPQMGDGRTVVPRRAPREITQLEIDRGNVGYVLTSYPSAESRWSTRLNYQRNAEGSFSPIGVYTGWVYNALGFNHSDNWLYAVSQPRYGDRTEDPCYPAGHLLQIDPVTGQVYNLGKITGNGENGYGFSGKHGDYGKLGVYKAANDLWGGISSGFIDSQDSYWVVNASQSGTGAIYKVDLNALTAQAMNPQQAFSTTIRDTASRNFNVDQHWVAGAEDFTELPFDDGHYAWGLVNNWLTTKDRVWIERINLDNGEVKRFDITNLRNPFGQRVPTNKIWGKAWFYGNGNLAFGTGSDGANADVVQIKISNGGSSDPKFELVTVMHNAPTSYNTDGASALVPVHPDLELKKDLWKEENGRVYWNLKLTNLGPGTSLGALVTDLLNPAFSDVKIESISDSTPKYTTTSGNNVQISFGVIKQGESVSIVLSAKNPTRPGCYENTASVVGLDQDNNPDNNTASDQRCSLSVEKVAVDYNGDGQITGDDAKISTANGERGVQFDIKVKGPAAGNALSYTLKDLPQFASGPELVGAQLISVTGAGAPTKVAKRTFGPLVTSEGWELVGASDGAAISPGQVHTYRIQVNFRSVVQSTTSANECTGKPGSGLFNKTSLISNGNRFEDNDCVPLIEDDEVTLGIEKVEYTSSNGSTGPVSKPLSGSAEFAIYGASQNGAIESNNKVATVATREAKKGVTGEFYYATLKPNTLYYLVETKAPVGYELLSQPVLFRIERGIDGKLQVVFFKSGDPTKPMSEGDGLVSVYSDGQKNTSTIALIQVADVTSGELPRTGGLGIAPWTVLGAIIAAFGAVAVRRRAA